MAYATKPALLPAQFGLGETQSEPKKSKSKLIKKPAKPKRPKNKKNKKKKSKSESNSAKAKGRKLPWKS